MPHARLIVDLPDRPLIADTSCEFSDAGFRLLTAVPGDDAGFVLVRITARDVDGLSRWPLDSREDAEIGSRNDSASEEAPPTESDETASATRNPVTTDT